jgi:hypothetical protein
MEDKKKKPLRKYTAIAKVGYDPAAKKNIMVLYRFNNMQDFLRFITGKYNVAFINIFYLAGNERGKLAYTWGKHKGLQNAY